MQRPSSRPGRAPPRASGRRPFSPPPRRDQPDRQAPKRTLGRVSWLGGKLGAAAVLAVGVVLLRWMLTAPQFQVTTVLVAGNDLVPGDQVVGALPLQGTNLFLVRGSRLAKSIEHNPAIAQAWVRPRLPNLLVIDIEEREPVVMWEEGETHWLVDGDGRVLGLGDRPLPIVSALTEGTIAPGQRVEAGVVRMARAVTPRLADLGLDSAKLEYDPGRGMAIVADGAYRVELGFGDQLAARLDAFETIRRYLQQSHTPVQLIDVRFLERPYFR